jgi:nitroreductase
MKIKNLVLMLAVLTISVFVFNGCSAKQNEQIQKENNSMSFMDLAKKRFSVRKYSDKPLEKEKLDKILAAGNIAPTAMNLQPQRIYVIQSKKNLEKLDTLTHCRYGAGTVLLFTYNTDEDWKNPKEKGIRSGIEDVSIVATHIMFEATELGVDTTWCNYFANSELEKMFNIPKNEKSVLIMPIGYRAEDSVPSPMHEQKKDITETVKYI